MRALLIGDLHCGHTVGLTPPGYQFGPDRNVQAAQWEWFCRHVGELGQVDFLLLNGDAIDGRGERSGGLEQIAIDRKEQVNMALEVVKLISPRSMVMTYGTPYHVGREENWEDVLRDKIATELGIPIKLGDHETAALGDCAAVDALILDAKHKVGGSQIPHGRHTAIARERLWNLMWAEREQRPKAHVIIRSHVHFFGYCGGQGWLAMTLPALQGLGSRYGARECAGTVDTGFVVLDVVSKSEYGWRAETVADSTRKASVFVANQVQAPRGTASQGAARHGVARQGRARAV